MLIVSKFHDYYDTASVYGVDKTCVYKRAEEEVPIKRPNWDKDYLVKLPDGKNFPITGVYGTSRAVYVGNTVGEVEVTQRVLGFCGQIYPVVVVSPNYGNRGKTHYFYQAEEFLKFVEKENLFQNRSRYRWRYFSSRWDKHNLEYEQGVKGFFDFSGAKKFEELFHAFKVPVFVLGSDKHVLLNPCLKSYGFMKVKDPQTAFQDIYMFISGVIGAPLPPKEKMSDEVLAAAKGHDGPYSFRKPPGKRGKKRWR